jgi:hypothetical protein
MSYTVINFKTKKALKEAVAKYNEVTERDHHPFSTLAVRCFNPGLGGDLSNFTGKVYLEGPHYPKPHTWYAEAELVDGVVIKVK